MYTDTHRLDNYSSIEIAKCEVDDTAHGSPVAGGSHFFLSSNDDVKNLKVDELRTELETRGLGNCGLKNEQENSEEAAAPNIFREGAFWKTLIC